MRAQKYSDTDALVWVNIVATTSAKAREDQGGSGNQGGHRAVSTTGEPESALGVFGGVAQQGVALSFLFVHEFADEFLSTFECQCFVSVYWLPCRSPEINTSAVGGVQPRQLVVFEVLNPVSFNGDAPLLSGGDEGSLGLFVTPLGGFED
jgi:hypothetical protein